MDPNVAFLNWLNADDPTEELEAGLALMDWLNGGGFAPNWTPDQKDEFHRWMDSISRGIV